MDWAGLRFRKVVCDGYAGELRIQLLLRALYWRALPFDIDTDLRWVMENFPKADYEGVVEIVCCFVEG